MEEVVWLKKQDQKDPEERATRGEDDWKGMVFGKKRRYLIIIVIRLRRWRVWRRRREGIGRRKGWNSQRIGSFTFLGLNYKS